MIARTAADYIEEAQRARAKFLYALVAPSDQPGMNKRDALSKLQAAAGGHRADLDSALGRRYIAAFGVWLGYEAAKGREPAAA